MSFILDALRKSENERRRQTGPALAAAPRATDTKKRSIWLPILAIVLTINAIVLATFLRNRSEPLPEVIIALPPIETKARSLRSESGADTSPVMKAGTPSSTIRSIPAATIASTTPATNPAAAAKPPSTPTKTIQEGLPSLATVRAAGLVSVANLHVDMHVYSQDAAKRFVFVNMNKYREGDQLAEGPTIEAITPDGVILIQQGNRFSMDRD